MERCSGYTLLAVLPRRTAPAFRETTVTFLGPFRDRVPTLTLDKGTEVADHERIVQFLGAVVYFADPDRS